MQLTLAADNLWYNAVEKIIHRGRVVIPVIPKRSKTPHLIMLYTAVGMNAITAT